MARMSRQDYLDFMSSTWDTYLASVNSLPEDEQQRYAQQQGFASLRHLIAHLDDWWEETLRLVPQWARAEAPDFEDFDSFETRSMARDRDENLPQIEEDFENLRGQVAAMIAKLPEESFDDQRIASWLNHVIVTHYREHQPAAEPQIPSAKYEKMYKND